MFEFTDAYLNPFDWAKKAYEYMLKLTINTEAPVSTDLMATPNLPRVPFEALAINTALDWNTASKTQTATLGGLYQSIDQAELYYNSLYSLVSSRLSESESRVRDQESALKAILTASRQFSTTAIHIKGGDTSEIETDSKYYKVFGPLAPVAEEGIFRLKDTGSFSSIRSHGGFGGRVLLEYSLGSIVENGRVQNKIGRASCRERV